MSSMQAAWALIEVNFHINRTILQQEGKITTKICNYYLYSSLIAVTGAPIAISSAAVLQSITTNTSSITTNVSSSNTAISASYAPQAGSFAVVPSSSRNVVNNTSSGMISSTVVQQSGSQPIPVRFNPQLLVDGNKESSSYDGLIQKQLGHQQVSFCSLSFLHYLFL